MTIVLPGSNCQCYACIFKGVKTDERLESIIIVVDFLAHFTSDNSSFSKMGLENELLYTIMTGHVHVPGPLDSAHVVAFLEDPLTTFTTLLTVLAKFNLSLFCSYNDLHATELSVLSNAVVDCIDPGA